MIDRTVKHRTLSLTVLCSAIAALTAHILLREWFLTVWSTGLLLLGSYLTALFWRPGETKQTIMIENWHAGDPVCPRPESHA